MEYEIVPVTKGRSPIRFAGVVIYLNPPTDWSSTRISESEYKTIMDQLDKLEAAVLEDGSWEHADLFQAIQFEKATLQTARNRILSLKKAKAKAREERNEMLARVALGSIAGINLHSSIAEDQEDADDFVTDLDEIEF